MRKTRTTVAVVACAFFTGGAHAALCSVDPVPAATLLMPYFEVGGCASPALDKTTRLIVTNTSQQSRLAHVTLWTNANVPAFDFDVYLHGYAQETIDLRALFCSGALPRTGTGTGGPGRLAAGEVNFTGCSSSSTPGATPNYAALDGAAIAQLRADFSAQPGAGGLCRSLPPPAPAPAEFTGFATVDLVDACNAPVAGEAGFATPLLEANVLAGRATLEDPAGNISYGYHAVAIEAASGAQLTGSRTFYDYDPAGLDLREPLPTAWGVDFSPGTGDVAELVIWRGLGQVGTPFACNSVPAWYPLDFANISGFSTRGALVENDDGRAAILQRSPPLAPVATQRVRPYSGFPTGFVRLNLQHSRLPLGEVGGQGWLMRLQAREGRYATEEVGTILDSSCTGPAFDNVSAGPGAPL